ncbi:hypothetical protein [Peribacillus frigoritolerans]|uniref:Uncharacterized protein n=1 Tax=Peribacillus castrilensis TaxID=2897690 RepID=A0AAW9NEA4_9BACI|nr:hypothetical protein [Peribacillus castrilensis]
MSFSESRFQQGIEDLLCNGSDASERWTQLAQFTRVAYQKDAREPLICAALHYILKSPKGDLFGIAITSDEFQGVAGDNIFQQGYDRLNSDRRLTDLYVYTLEKYALTFGSNQYISTSNGVKRAALDLESFGSDLRLDHQQSPIIPVRMRKVTNSEKFFTDKQYSNWWEDSQIRVKGYYDDKMLFFTIQSDTSPAWANNETPKIPLYFGRFSSFSEDNGDNVALFAGTYEGATKKPIMPLRKDYYSSPGSGISNIIVRQSKYGARYQAHYLSWNATPAQFPPNQGGSLRKTANEINRYPFNPSTYSDQVEASIAYIIHPEDGVYGSLSNIILSNHLSILDGDELEVQTAYCHTSSENSEAHDHYDDYVVTAIDSACPFTIIGSTPSLPTLVAVRKNKPTYINSELTNY